MSATDKRNAKALVKRMESILSRVEALQNASCNGKDRASEKIGYGKRELIEAWHILIERVEGK